MIMRLNWGIVTANHVLAAIQKFDRDCEKVPIPRNTFLIYNNRKYPAKHIRGMAYEIAYGVFPDKDDYAGGNETEKFFTKLGFEVLRTNKLVKSNDVTAQKPIKAKGYSVVAQKNALQKLLQKKFGMIETEKKFDWLRVPPVEEMDEVYRKIHKAIEKHRGHKTFAKAGYKLSCDFYFEQANLIVEYDERQHFTFPRRITLENYPKSLKCGFSFESWIAACNKYKASDNDPIDRDETRAFYDCVRDIEAAKRGILLVRIKHGDFNWEGADTEKHLDEIFHSINMAPQSVTIPQNHADKLLKIFDWRSFEIEFQRIRLNYLKWLFYFSPPKEEFVPEMGKGKNFIVLQSDNGRSFSLSPSGFGNTYFGGKGSLSLPKGVYNGNQDILDETEELKRSLNERTKKLRECLLATLISGDYKLLWSILQNFWWIKVGLHEYIGHGGEFEIDKEKSSIDANNIRDYLLTSMYYGADIQESVPNKFADSELKEFIKSLRWNRYGCCSFDSGPLAWGREGYVPYTKVAEARKRFNNSNYNKYSEEDIAPGTELRHQYAIESLKNIYEYGILYHLPPFSDDGDWRYRDFVYHQTEVRELIKNVQNNLNNIIINEELKSLHAFEFVPESNVNIFSKFIPKIGKRIL